MAVAIVVAGAGSPSAAQDRSWVFCWQHGHTQEECCGSRGDRPSCFDSIYTEKECCSIGFARLFPSAEPEPPDWAAAARWAAGDRGAARQHPSFRRAQRQWEAGMANASVALSEDILGQHVHLLAFKRSGPALNAVMEELAEDLYRLRQVGAPPAGQAPIFAIDVGASVGAVAVLLAKLWPHARILAVEPAPANYRYLLWNIRLNGVSDRVWPLNLAVGAVPSAAQAFFYSPTYPTWSQASHDEAEEAAAADTGKGEESWRGGWTDWQVRFEVEIATLAELIASVGLGEVHMLKVDCEGCEWGVFAPLSWGRLRHRVRHVAAELHAWALPEAGAAGEEAEEESRALEAAVRQAICDHKVTRENTLCSTM